MSAQRPGARPLELSRTVVVATALELVDREGVRALTMRRLGQELGVQAMAAYRYLPSKDALIDAMVRHALEPVTSPVTGRGRWPAALVEYAWSLRESLLAHPGVTGLLLTRPSVARAVMGTTGRGMHVLGASGSTSQRVRSIIRAVCELVLGHAAAEAAGAVALPGDPLGGLGGALGTPWWEVSSEARFDAVLTALLTGFGVRVPLPEHTAEPRVAGQL